MLQRLPRLRMGALAIARRSATAPFASHFGVSFARSSSLPLPPLTRHTQLLFSTLAQSKKSDDDEKDDSNQLKVNDDGIEKEPSASKVGEVRRLLNLYQPEKKQTLIAISALSVSTVITMCVPFGMGKVIDAVTAADAGLNLPYVVGGLGGLFVVGSIANVLRVDVTNMIGERITNRLRQDTYESIVKQDLGFFDSSRTGELINRLSADTTLIGKVLSDQVSNGLRSSGQAIGSVTMLFITCPKLAMVMLAIV
ncbi:Atp-binding cassette sub-family b member 10, partial [Globisporangium polare]